MRTSFTIGVAGHVDHGKTTLVRALTGIDTDRKAEEKVRGLSIESGVAELKLPSGRRAALIDVPGHTDYLKSTIRGLNGVDIAILVVAADDGVMPQTREHLEILKAFNTISGVVVLSKTDLVDEETLELAQLELEEILSGTCFDQCPIFKFTDQRSEIGAQIVEGVDVILNDISVKEPDRPFRMWVDQVRSIRGHGTVVSGTVAAGILGCHDDVEILPSGIKTRARSLESHACAVKQATVGQRVGINLHRVALADVKRGASIGAPGTLTSSFLLNAEINIIDGAKKGIQNRQRVKIYLGTSITNAMVIFMQQDHLNPGESGLAQIRLMRPLAALPRDTFVVSPLNVNQVIAGGRVLEIPREKYRVVKSTRVLPLLLALQKEDIGTYVDHLFENARGSLISAKGLSKRTGLPSTPFEKTINSKVQAGELVYIKGHGAIKKSHLSIFQKQFQAAIAGAFGEDPMKKCIGIAEIAARLGAGVDAALLKITAHALCKNGDIVSLDGGYCPAEGQPPLNVIQDRQLSFILDYIHSAGLTPISAAFFSKQHPCEFGRAQATKIFNYLYRQKKLVRLSNNRFLSLKAFSEIKERVARAIRDRGFITLGDCKELFGYGRSVGAHVLDHLNQIGFTTRKGDNHYLKQKGSS